MSPTQFQRQIRLQEARCLMLGGSAMRQAQSFGWVTRTLPHFSREDKKALRAFSTQGQRETSVPRLGKLRHCRQVHDICCSSKHAHFGVRLNPAHHLVGRIECYLGLVRTCRIR
jgi:hypothetical protein